MQIPIVFPYSATTFQRKVNEMADAGPEWVIKKFCPEFASIQRMQYLSHSWKFSCNFYYSAVFSMTSCEAIWQLPFYNNSMHWQVDLVEMKPDHCFLLVGQQQNFLLDPSKNSTRWLSFIIYHLAFPDTNLMHRKSRCGMQEYRLFLLRN